MKNRNRLWELIQAYMDDPGHRYPPKVADLARETGVSDQVISKWKGKPMLPSVAQMAKFSHGTGIGYLELLTSALIGKGYLPDGPDIELELKGDIPAEVEEAFLGGLAAPPSGWAGTRLFGTTQRGRPLTPLPVEGGDGDAEEHRGPAPTSAEPTRKPARSRMTQADRDEYEEIEEQARQESEDESPDDSELPA